MPKRSTAKSPTRIPIERSHRTTGINLPAEMWELLNRVAFERAKKYGGRASVSKLLVELLSLAEYGDSLGGAGSQPARDSQSRLGIPTALPMRS